MTNNTQLPAAVENAIIKESYDKYNLVRQGGEREAYREGAIEYASKLHQIEQATEDKIDKALHTERNKMQQRFTESETAWASKLHTARTLLQKFISRHEARLLPDRFIYDEIKKFLDGTK